MGVCVNVLGINILGDRECRDAAREARQRRIEARQGGRTDRTATRQDGRTDRTDLRTDPERRNPLAETLAASTGPLAVVGQTVGCIFGGGDCSPQQNQDSQLLMLGAAAIGGGLLIASVSRR